MSDDIFLGAVVIDVNDLETMTSFWRDVLHYDVELHKAHWCKLTDPRRNGTSVSLQKVPESPRGKNRLHLDLYTKSPEAEIERLVGLWASVEQGPEADKDFVVLADPEGNLFCVIDKSE